MKLKKYLQKNKLTQNQFIDELHKNTGRKIGQGTVSKYILGQRIPRKEEMLVIYDFTEGKVSPNDFYL